MKIPPMLAAPHGSPADQATQDLVESCRPLAVFVVSLPDSDEKQLAAEHLNAAMLWAHQALLRSMGAQRVHLASVADLPNG